MYSAQKKEFLYSISLENIILQKTDLFSVLHTDKFISSISTIENVIMNFNTSSVSKTC